MGHADRYQEVTFATERRIHKIGERDILSRDEEQRRNKG